MKDFKQGDKVFIKPFDREFDNLDYFYVSRFKEGHLVSVGLNLKEDELWYIEDVKLYEEKVVVTLSEIAKWKGCLVEQLVIE